MFLLKVKNLPDHTNYLRLAGVNFDQYFLTILQFRKRYFFHILRYDFRNHTVIMPTFKKYSLFASFILLLQVVGNCQNHYPVKINQLWGLMDASGKVVVQPQYEII
ncbi:MAG: hypothetical protein AAGJ18_08620, partial [Bacteroidota bacterium]